MRNGNIQILEVLQHVAQEQHLMCMREVAYMHISCPVPRPQQVEAHQKIQKIQNSKKTTKTQNTKNRSHQISKKTKISKIEAIKHPQNQE